jgi:hypothetical protein
MVARQPAGLSISQLDAHITGQGAELQALQSGFVQ